MQNCALHRTGGAPPEQLFCIAVRNSFPVGVADRKPVAEGAALRHRLIGVIGRKHDAVDADLEYEIEERRQEVEARERTMDVLAQMGARLDWSAFPRGARLRSSRR